MQTEVTALEKLVPEAITLFKERYKLLQTILECGPIGRRGLANQLILSERTIRNEVDKLTKQGLVQTSIAGISITKSGEDLLSKLYLTLHMLEESSRLEEKLRHILQVRKVIVIRGNIDQDETVKDQFGYAIASLLEKVLKDYTTIAITGGTTIAKMVEHMPRMTHTCEHIHIIPARGSVGQRVELQAHTIAVAMAEKLSAEYELLAIPDNLSHQSLNLIKSEPQIQKILQKIAKTDIIIFGIGNAIKMAKHRKEQDKVLELLEDKGAIAEVFRHYLDAEGKVVYASESIGVGPEEARKIPIRIAVAGGSSKANAILAARELLKGSYLILDEGAAKKIISQV